MESQMILNHKEAIEFLIASASDIGFNRYTVLNLHALLADNLLTDPSASGRLRRIPVGIGHTVFMPLEGPQMIDGCFQQVLDTTAAIADPFEQAFFAMVHWPYLQPFEDVNKRVSRLAVGSAPVRQCMTKPQAIGHVRDIALQSLPASDQSRFVEVVHDQLMNLHEGNMARYWLRPSEFAAWRVARER